MGRLFGTDGARGVANAELTCEMAMNIGRAAAMVLTNDSRMRPKILIGKDTRISSDMHENALAAGLCSVGAECCNIGCGSYTGCCIFNWKVKSGCRHYDFCISQSM